MPRTGGRRVFRANGRRTKSSAIQRANQRDERIAHKHRQGGRLARAAAPTASARRSPERSIRRYQAIASGPGSYRFRPHNEQSYGARYRIKADDAVIAALSITSSKFWLQLLDIFDDQSHSVYPVAHRAQGPQLLKEGVHGADPETGIFYHGNIKRILRLHNRLHQTCNAR